ncbi:Fructose-1,6-bisphosphatase, partial [Ascosphaera pollenicola]
AKPAETPSKLGRKRKREPEKRDKETEFLQEARFDKPVIEVPTTIPRRKNITEKPLPQKTPRDKDDTAKRPAKMKKHHQRIESITALERQRSTETPKGSKEDAFDNIPGKTASVAPPQSHHRTQSTHIPVEKPRLRTRRSETVAVAVAVAADKPYSLRGENGSSDAAVVVNKVEVVRPKETAAEEAVIGSPRVTRRRGTRREKDECKLDSK